MTAKTSNYDIFGMVISILCGIHCIVTPILIMSAPRIGEGLQSPVGHSLMIALMAFSFYQSVYKDFKKHQSKLTLGLGLSGFIFILISYVNEILSHGGHGHGYGYGHNVEHVGHFEVHHDETLFVVIAILGAALLVTSHFFNIRNCRCLKGKGTCRS